MLSKEDIIRNNNKILLGIFVVSILAYKSLFFHALVFPTNFYHPIAYSKFDILTEGEYYKASFYPKHECLHSVSVMVTYTSIGHKINKDWNGEIDLKIYTEHDILFNNRMTFPKILPKTERDGQYYMDIARFDTNGLKGDKVYIEARMIEPITKLRPYKGMTYITVGPTLID